MKMLLAQSASLDAAMSEGLGIIAKFLFIVALEYAISSQARRNLPSCSA
jgi:hypothetical protein